MTDAQKSEQGAAKQTAPERLHTSKVPTIDNPIASGEPGTNYVLVGSAPGMGKLCVCDGYAHDGQVAADQVKVKRYPQGQEPTDPNGGLSATPDAIDGHWHVDNLQAQCSAGGTTNYLKVFAKYTGDTNWYPKKTDFVGTCGTCQYGAVAKADQSGALAKAEKKLGLSAYGPLDAYPKCQDGWLHYLHLPVSRRDDGAILKMVDHPLSARFLSVYAYDIHWRHRADDARTVIESPMGNYQSADAGWWLAGGLQYSIVVWQPYDNGSEAEYHLITSESADKPQTIVVDLSRQIFVQVNERDTVDDYEDNLGGFNLAVRVIQPPDPACGGDCA